MLFHTWFLSPGLVFSRFLYVVACITSSFQNDLIIFHCMNTPHSVYPLISQDGHLGFYLLANYIYY